MDGTIDVTKLGSFTPAGGTQYTLLSAVGGITDLGVLYNLPSGFGASIVDTTDLVITFGLPGDFNNDGIVDAADYTVWRDNLGAADESALNGNGNGSNGVDEADYALWKSNFGMTLGGGSGSLAANGQVPEPASCVVALLGLLGLGVLRKRRA